MPDRETLTRGSARYPRPGTTLRDGLVQCRSCGMTEDFEHADQHWWWITTDGLTGEWECLDCEQAREHPDG